MRDIPSSWSEVTIRHRIAHYTLLPFMALVFVGVIATIPLYLLGALSFRMAIVAPWLLLLAAMVYIMLLGEYVMPAETYRKYRSGEWGDE